ncbi:glycoside hydrolase [Aspergillus heteromorphus CBS 117.55]|uniref:chitinase n=1 Tax=Aspergillus heteromorphus CBS 117.55 TaxID=1448321 RepID=A0A317WAS0_9EURO|nr:glycoside hydrolase [Aspergillus heteromorphus CBS 117.55]PWY82995.1 glycoside hydrolase [Aspergillus heteromorphus CBS 117.55]
MATPSVFSYLLFLLLGWQLVFSAALSDNVTNAAFPSDFNNLLVAQEYTCTKSQRCERGCCGPIDDTGTGNCGFGPDFCGDKCNSDCDRKAECDPGWGTQWSQMSTCPLNVCCSKFGFCGTSHDFCGDKVVVSPQCNGNSASNRTIGYYEAWNLERPCGKMGPKDIPLGYYTHINFAFAYIDPQTFRIAPMDNTTAPLYRPVTALKGRQSGLKVWIAVGGWAMNDPGPSKTTFSDLAASEASQDTFFDSLLSFMQSNNFDGVDLDWEYPVADDRGGRPEDFANYVTLLKRLRERLNQSGNHYGVSITLPASYWYLRGFDIVNLEPHVDFFNIMTYDIHGVWDSTNKEIGSFAHAHTNLTEINAGLELLWRNNINPERVNLGLGFYARSFTMKDPSCMKPGCPFTGGARAGECSGTEGVLAEYEINKIIQKGGAEVTLYKDEAVKVVTWDKDQWASWDDQETMKLKIQYANQRCLGGTMVWAIDLDDGTLVGELGKAQGKNRSHTLPENPQLFPDLGTVDVDDLLGWKKATDNRTGGGE